MSAAPTVRRTAEWMLRAGPTGLTSERQERPSTPGSGVAPRSMVLSR